MEYFDEEICDPCGSVKIFKEDPDTGNKWCDKCQSWFFAMRMINLNQLPIQTELQL